MEPKVLEPEDLDDFKDLSNLERCTARAASVLQDLEKKLQDEKDTSARDLLKRAMEGNLDVMPERMADLAITLCIVKKGMKDVENGRRFRYETSGSSKTSQNFRGLSFESISSHDVSDKRQM